MKTDWPADKITRRKYVRQRECVSCGKLETVRKDNKSETCKSCAARKSGAKGLDVIRAKSKKKQCKTCGADMPAFFRWENCSIECKKASNRIERKCKKCGVIFKIRKSALKTNASGNFCSRDCYHNWMCRTERVTGRGSQWARSRKDALIRQPFCGLCGTTKNLQVHHIIPFRLTADNSQGNLMPLCVKHHRIVENIFLEVEEFGHGEDIKLIWRSMLMENAMATRAVLKGIIDEI